MYILQDGKVYVQEKTNIVGIEIYADKVLTVKGTECKLLDKYETYNLKELKIKFQITEDNPYIFPYVKPKEKVKEVVANEPIVNAKSTTGKSKRK